MATVVQAVSTVGGWASSWNISLSAVGSGNALVVAVLAPTSTTISDVTDNGGATPSYTNDYSNLTIRSSSFGINCRSRLNITDAPTQVTVTYSGNTFEPMILVLEVSDLSSDPFGQSNLGTDGYGTAQTASVTTTVANELGICYSGLGSSRTWTNPTGYTRAPTDTDPVNNAMFYIADLGAVGSKTADPTIDSGTNMQVGMVTYEPQSAGSSSALPLINAYYS